MLKVYKKKKKIKAPLKKIILQDKVSLQESK
jgi:hypothetical protein